MELTDVVRPGLMISNTEPESRKVQGRTLEVIEQAMELDLDGQKCFLGSTLCSAKAFKQDLPVTDPALKKQYLDSFIKYL